jgi:CYTH domain-containing protein
VPVENELKVILHADNLPALLNAIKKLPESNTYDITQGYLSGSTRIRHVVPHDSSSKEQFLFTFKKSVLGNVVEIETEISVHDYHKLFLIVKPVVHKTRIKYKNGNHTWDIDFFKTPKNGNIYLAMAEVEMSEFEFETPEPLDILKPYIVKWVEVGDKRFSNKNLWNAGKVSQIVREITSAKKIS